MCLVRLPDCLFLYFYQKNIRNIWNFGTSLELSKTRGQRHQNTRRAGYWDVHFRSLYAEMSPDDPWACRLSDIKMAQTQDKAEVLVDGAEAQREKLSAH